MEELNTMQMCWISSILEVEVCHTNVLLTFIINRPNKTKLYPEKAEIEVILQFGVIHAVLSYWEYTALKAFDMTCCPMQTYKPSCPILNNFKKPDENNPCLSTSFATGRLQRLDQNLTG